MDSGAVERRLIRFGAFEADLAAGELRKSGVRLKLQEQPFQVLAALLERPGDLVTREELKERLWSSDTFVDFDRGLNTAVNKIREALGDSANSPRFVETVPRRGYRFLAGVSGTPKVAGASNRRSLVSSRAVAVAGAVLVAALSGWLSSRNDRTRSTSLTVTPLTSYAGYEFQPTFSPDGTQVAFAGCKDTREHCDIYVKQIAVDQPSRLTAHPDHEFSPAWSPTGTLIAFMRIASSVSRVQVILIPQRGGPEEILTEFPAVLWHTRPASYDSLLGWGPQGDWIVTSGTDKQSEAVGLFAVHVESKQRHPVTWPEQTQHDMAPAVSPNGRSLVFSRYGGLHRSSLYLLQLSEDMKPMGEPVRLPSADMENHHPVWTADGKEIVFAAGSLWNDSLWIMEPVEHATPRRLGVTNGGQPAIARSQDRLVFAQVGSDWNVWQVELPGRDGQLLDPAPLLNSTFADLAPNYSSNGEKIAFMSTRSGWSEIWLSNADGSNRKQLTSFGGPLVQWPKWSPTRNEIVFYSEAEGNAEIYVIDVAQRTMEKLTDHPGYDADPRWSSDGDFIYFISDRGGPRAVWKMPRASGGEAIRLEVRLAQPVVLSMLVESPDGKTLYFSDNDGIWSVPVEGGEEIRITGPVARYAFLEVAEDGLYFFGEAGEAGIKPIQFLSFESGQVETVARPTAKNAGFLAIAPDRRTLLYCQQDSLGSDLMLAEGFR